MKRRVVKTLLTTAVCVSMLGTTCLASNPPSELVAGTTSSTITGDSTVENPIYKVTVPTEITFAVDPFEQKNQSQIYSKELPLINKSNVAVQVTASVKVEGKVDANDATKSVTVVDAESKVTETDTAKKVYIAAQIPKDVAETDADAAAYPTALKKSLTTNKVYADNQVPDSVTDAAALEDMVDTTAVKGTYTNSKKVTLSGSDTKLVFVLEKATYQEYCTDKTDLDKTASQYKEVATGTNGSTVFRFWGKVNTKATWENNDLKATVKYDLIGLTGTNYAAAAATVDANAHAYVASTPESDGTTAVSIPFTGTAPTAGTITITAAGGATFTPDAGAYPANIEITTTDIVIKTDWLSAWRTIDEWGTGEYTVTAGGQTYKFNLN